WEWGRRGAVTQRACYLPIMPTVLVTGATGFVGQAIVSRFMGEGWSVVALTRDPSAARRRLPGVVMSLTLSDLSGNPALQLDAVVHLAGASIAGGLWTQKRKQMLWRSRVDGTRALVAALGNLDAPPPVVVSASGMGYYGHRGEALVHL